jgi:hypothetical protein
MASFAFLSGRPSLLVFLFLFPVSVVHSSPNCHSLDLKCVSWNVNGAAKFSALTPELHYLKQFDIVILQETFTTSPENGIDLTGFIPFHVVGRSTGGCRLWRLSTLLKIDTFVGGTLKQVHSPMDWIQVTRWRTDSDRGILIVDIYVAVHTASFAAADTRAALDYIVSLRADFPADCFLMGGDMYVDGWRLVNQRNSGVSVSQKAR